MWGFVFDTTVRDLPPPRQAAQHPFTLAASAEPHIEPEIVFRLAAAPSPDMDEPALFGCIDWVAQGFEIVQSVFRLAFEQPLEVRARRHRHRQCPARRSAACARQPAGFGSSTDWVSNLAGFEIELLRDGTAVDRGKAANVLDGPLSALCHLVGALARDPVNSPLASGDIVTTGTLTRAFPLARGELEHDASRHRPRRQACLVRVNQTSPRQQDATTHRLARVRQPRHQGISGQILPKPGQRCLGRAKTCQLQTFNEGSIALGSTLTTPAHRAAPSPPSSQACRSPR
jgi:hypothetical protein